MRRLYVFSLPKGEGGEESDLHILDSIARKFSLGNLKYYDRTRSRGYTYLYGKFTRGSTVVKIGEGLAMAFVRTKERREVSLR